MKRRELLATGSASVIVGVSGCIDELQEIKDSELDGAETDNDEPEEETIPTAEIRDAACSHVPDGAERLEYVAEEYREGLIQPIIADANENGSETSPLALITAREEAETGLKPEQTEASPAVVDGVHAFRDATNFDEQVLLVRQAEVSPAGIPMEVVGVTRPEEGTIRAYTCTYANGPTSAEILILLLRINTSNPLRQAELTNRDGVPRHSEDKIDISETTYVTN